MKEEWNGYAEGTVNLGTPKATWLLRNALIAAASGDVYEGVFSIRAQVNKEASSTARIELKDDVEFTVLEFAVATFSNDPHGVQIRIEYSTNSGETWLVASDGITVDSTDILTYRVNVPAGAGLAGSGIDAVTFTITVAVDKTNQETAKYQSVSDNRE